MVAAIVRDAKCRAIFNASTVLVPNGWSLQYPTVIPYHSTEDDPAAASGRAQRDFCGSRCRSRCRLRAGQRLKPFIGTSGRGQ